MGADMCNNVEMNNTRSAVDSSERQIIAQESEVKMSVDEDSVV